MGSALTIMCGIREVLLSQGVPSTTMNMLKKAHTANTIYKPNSIVDICALIIKQIFALHIYMEFKNVFNKNDEKKGNDFHVRTFKK